MKLRYTPESIADLERLRAFIAEQNPSAARRIAGSLLEAIERLRIFPKMGLPVRRAPDPDSIRDLFVDSYTIRYLLARQSIIILRIWHDKEHEKDSKLS